jgi:predicted CoA-binding protein
MNETAQRFVAVLGASDHPERYSYMATQRLLEHGFSPIPVNPTLKEVLGLPVVSRLGEIQQPVDTLTVYLSPKRSTPLADEITQLRPRRVILNPGAENEELQNRLDQAGIPWLHACSLVLLSTGRF